MKQKYPIGLEPEQAVELIKKRVSKVGIEEVPLEQTRNRILAETVTAREPVPPFDRSPYDGYAFRAVDVAKAAEDHPVTLRVIEEVPAGYEARSSVGEGEAVKILTGAPIPKGADVVEMFEKVTMQEDTIILHHSLKSGSNICCAGEDVEQGRMLLVPGKRLRSADIGLLAALGYAKVKCYRKLRCVIICTGSELLPVQEPLAPGKIRNSSGYMFQAILREWGMDCDYYGIVKDDVKQITEALRKCAEDYDVIFTTGGVSVGDYDLLEASLESLQAEILAGRIQMKPGMAFFAARYREKLLLCLSGNPSAAAASLHMIGKPVLAQMAGSSQSSWEKCKVRFLHGFPKASPGRRFVPGVLTVIDGVAYLDSTIKQGNGMISPWNCCDIIGEIPKGSPAMEAGSLIDAYYFGS